MDQDYIIHWGIKGMRWGVRRTPDQLGHAPKKKLSRKQKRKLKKRLEKAREAKKTKQEFEAEKKKAIESGTAADVLKFKGKLTNTELQTAVNRINMESQLSQINARTKKSGLDKVSSFMDGVDKARGAVEKGVSAWNVAAKINNSLSDTKLPVLDGSKKSAVDSALDGLVKKGTAEQISKHFGQFSTKQLEDISKRMNYEDAIRRRLNKE